MGLFMKESLLELFRPASKNSSDCLSPIRWLKLFQLLVKSLIKAPILIQARAPKKEARCLSPTLLPKKWVLEDLMANYLIFSEESSPPEGSLTMWYRSLESNM